MKSKLPLFLFILGSGWPIDFKQCLNSMGWPVYSVLRNQTTPVD